ncbi:MAG: hypothetical protein B7Y26_12070 [Hydrogenophilales bacterium 16-64-46]|nr:MAG: hypothetical protein B7Z32_10570 [Hydrogenophilales bacterium 12-64-13]OYZ04456.1 MAG: hypothetical protein B7Y26_12070 [Hydrogenophilales bacterium 16-64-46]OZA38183.1 MAG: hypothetical protein B7X87_06680 [Hydrogenophilales bacterium 17-64-34]HQS99079.1 sulfotransferase [Thiobacillus sp.]
MAGVGRKDPCPCGSGKRYKHCCGTAEPHGAATQAAQAGAAQLYRQGHRAHLAGNKAEAARHYQATLARQPEHPDALHYLGMLLMEAGRADQAAGMVRRSLELKPRDADFWANAALLEQALGQPDAAVRAYRESIFLAPGDAERCMLLGSLLLMLGRTDEALPELERSCRLNPALGQAWYLLGNAHMKSRPPRYEDALDCFRKVLKRLPRHVDARISMATAMAMTQRRAEALTLLREAEELEPANIGVLSNLVSYWLEGEAADEAVAYSRKIVALRPNAVESHVELGCALKAQGTFDEALSVFRHALTLKPGDLAVMAHIVGEQRYDRLDDPELLQARHLADSVDDAKEGLDKLCFALGRALDRLGAYEAAFACYARGNWIAARDAPFDREAFSSWVDRQIARFDKAAISALRPFSDPTPRPVYIVGMPRSGTTLTDQILSAHSRVAGGGERMYWPYVDKELSLGELLADDGVLARKLVTAGLEDLETVDGAALADRVTDKMPDNFKRLGLLHGLQPNARIIHVRRNPADTCLSIYFQNFKGHEYGRNLDDLAFYYRQYRRLMDHWRAVLPSESFFEFDYEELVANQEATSRQLVAFCGLDWESACLNFHENRKAVRTASIWQVRQKMYSGSVARWRHYEPYIQPLLDLNADCG